MKFFGLTVLMLLAVSAQYRAWMEQEEDWETNRVYDKVKELIPKFRPLSTVTVTTSTTSTVTTVTTIYMPSTITLTYHSLATLVNVVTGPASSITITNSIKSTIVTTLSTVTSTTQTSTTSTTTTTSTTSTQTSTWYTYIDTHSPDCFCTDPYDPYWTR
jgi:hypothetical protein